MARQVHHAHQDLGHSLRALSHDTSANLMLLQSSFAQLKQSLARPTEEIPPAAAGSPRMLGTRLAHVDACLSELQRLLDDLARLARSGTVDMESEQVELAAVVDEVLFEQSELLARRNVEVTVHRPLPLCRINRGRLKQVVTNLVRNAALHGCDPQHPQIVISSPATASVADSIGCGAMAALRIHDNGPALDEELRDEIFLPGRSFAKSGVPSSGMGLAIVRQIVEHYGGSVFVDPGSKADPGGNTGTTFVVRLPAADGPKRGRSAQQQTAWGTRHPVGKPQTHGLQPYRQSRLKS